jgi:hypothetical protein
MLSACHAIGDGPITAADGVACSVPVASSRPAGRPANRRMSFRFRGFDGQCLSPSVHCIRDSSPVIVVQAACLRIYVNGGGHADE